MMIALRAVIVVIIAIALPFLLGEFWAYQLGLYALYAVAAVGVGLCWGQAGFLPLGQALFFGLAAYLSGLAFIAFADSPVVAVVLLPLAALASGGDEPATEVKRLRSPVNVPKRQVEELVERDPDRVAQQVRAWMSED